MILGWVICCVGGSANADAQNASASAPIAHRTDQPRKLIQSSFRTKKPHFEPYTRRLCRGSYRLPLQGLAFGAPISIRPKKVFQAQMVQAGLGFFPSVPTGGSQSLVNRGRRLPF